MDKVKRTDIEKKVLGLVSKVWMSSLNSNGNMEIFLDTDIRKNLNFDSIMLVVLQVELEDEFHIRFNWVEEDVRMVFTTVQNISDYVLNRLED